jgi:membrane associated rhomboid family serine protease
VGPSVCGRCGTWVNDEQKRCHQCGRLWPALFGYRRAFDRFFSPSRSQAHILLGLLVALYLVELMLSAATPVDGRRSSGISLNPNGIGLVRSGALLPWRVEDVQRHVDSELDRSTRQEPWRVVSAMLLHGGVLHIVMNGASLLTLGLFIENLFGPARFWIAFVVTGICGNVASLLLPAQSFAVGASGGIFGLIGAMLGWGLRRGGTYGAAIKQQTIKWLIYGAVISMLPGIGWLAHLGGAVSGFLLSYVFKIPDSRTGRESDGARLLALACMALLAVGVACALISAAHWGR